MNRDVGGYFELEISDRGTLYHDDALALNSGRNGFEYILRTRGYKRVHIPYFTCEVVLQPLIKLNIEYSFYHIDESFTPLIIDYRANDAILYTNYFGLNFHNSKLLVNEYQNLIIDNSQAFFDKPLDKVSTFYSPRKFFGVPDGGFVYEVNEVATKAFERDNSVDRLAHLLIRVEAGAERGYEIFKQNDAKLHNQPIRLMSHLTQKLLRGIEFDEVIQKRCSNFQYLHKHLKNSNKLTPFIENALIKCPLVYPFFVDQGPELRKKLVENKIFTSMYWPNVLESVENHTVEYKFTKNIICLPIDQRYNNEFMQYIIDIVKNV